MKYFAALLLSLFCLGCTNPEVALHPANPAVWPKTFAFSISSAWGGGFTLEKTGDALILSKTPLTEIGQTPKRAKVFTIRPSEYQWKAFWNQVAILQVFQWKASYEPSELGATVFDGCGWKLDISYADKHLTSFGNNAYPSASNVRKASLEDDRFDLFVAAVEQLIGESLD